MHKDFTDLFSIQSWTATEHRLAIDVAVGNNPLSRFVLRDGEWRAEPGGAPQASQTRALLDALVDAHPVVGRIASCYRQR